MRILKEEGTSADKTIAFDEREQNMNLFIPSQYHRRHSNLKNLLPKITFLSSVAILPLTRCRILCPLYPLGTYVFMTGTPIVRVEVLKVSITLCIRALPNFLQRNPKESPKLFLLPD